MVAVREKEMISPQISLHLPSPKAAVEGPIAKHLHRHHLLWGPLPGTCIVLSDKRLLLEQKKNVYFPSHVICNKTTL